MATRRLRKPKSTQTRSARDDYAWVNTVIASDAKAAIDELAERRGITRAHLLRDALSEYLKRHEHDPRTERVASLLPPARRRKSVLEPLAPKGGGR